MVDGIYIHIPFCMNKCNYCDFLSFKSNEEERKKYVDYILKEIDLYPKYEYDTVYLGGGTPSLLNCEDVERIIKKLNIKAGAEITLEVNPKTVNLEKLKGFKKAGINRVSIGIQTFDEKMLQVLGRMHNSNEGIETYYQAREAGFDNISLDLIYGLPYQNILDFENSLKEALELNINHISLYGLKIEEGCYYYDNPPKELP
ncbi:MAG: coproporphyrinogen III oxidase family protein, partial [Fusobacterium mortiferum]|nr:coproporphyrinogen III oxidase family protein [Fusobacterium mortiferum]